jgi:hypothetical protein
MMKTYYAFLLRLWLGIDADPSAWRASLEDPHTRQLIQFSQLSDLYAYLADLVAQETQSQPISPSIEEK